jgi:hypothetical protein
MQAIRKRFEETVPTIQNKVPTNDHNETTQDVTKDDDVDYAKKDATLHSLDGLVVIPKIKFISHIYVCQDRTDFKSFEVDPLAAELRLRDQLYSLPPSPSSAASSSAKPFKLSGASCMLEHEPNGFICVSASSKSVVDVARNEARQLCQTKSKLHSDHAHHVCTLPTKALHALLKARSRSEAHHATQILAQHLNEENVPILSSKQEDEDGNKTDICIELGHHLRSLLYIQQPNRRSPNQRSEPPSSEHWMTIVYDDGIIPPRRNNNTSSTGSNTRRKIVVDLPGGKRHLGETSLKGAIRETEEECSLIVDESWVKGPPVMGGTKDERLNIFFMLQPPTQHDVVDDMTNDPFWTNTGLGPP